MPPNPAIPSPRQGECKPPDRIEAVIGHLRGTLYWLNHPKWLRRRRSNVDKQRRRLLADRLFQEAEFFEAMAYTHRIKPVDEDKAAWSDAHASKLRTIAARLRATAPKP